MKLAKVLSLKKGRKCNKCILYRKDLDYCLEEIKKHEKIIKKLNVNMMINALPKDKCDDDNLSRKNYTRKICWIIGISFIIGFILY
jgi:hypothetical protein